MEHETVGIERFVQSMGWLGAVRNDGKIARQLTAGEAVDAVYNIDGATVADQLFHWLDSVQVLNPFRRLRFKKKQRHAITPESLLLTYFMRCMCQVPSMNSLPDLLFADKGLMRRLGFNAHQLEHGLTQRGANRSGTRVNLPIDPEMLSENIAQLEVEDVRKALTESLRLIWLSLPRRPRRVMLVIDGTLIEMGESAKGGAWTKRKKTIKTKDGPKTIEESFYGYVLVWLYEPATGLPLAAAFGPANADEKSFVPQLLDSAERVLSGLSQMDVVALDRGYFDGPTLYHIKERGIDFIIPAKKNANVWQEARDHAAPGAGALPQYLAERTSEKEDLKLTGIEGLTTFETYAPAAKVKNGRHVDTFKKDFTANPINAVVARYNSRFKDDDDGLVLLTSRKVNKPLRVYDDYDDRSLIENKNRCLKQDFNLCKPPKRDYKPAEIHGLFVLLAFACATAHMLYLDHQHKLIDRSRPSTLGDYLRQLARENRDQVIVFNDRDYGIFYACELMMLRGIRVKEPNPRAAKTPEEIFARTEF